MNEVIYKWRGKDYRLPYCTEYKIRLHKNTFVYYDSQNRNIWRRNFIVREDLAEKIAHSPKKAENHRLGDEMSEDALSWNVFVSLAETGKLRAAAKFLVGHDIDDEPKLYLWGQRVDPTGWAVPYCYKPLEETRAKLETGIRQFLTELDIMLVLDDRMIILIEAKFGSGNTMADLEENKHDKKPTSKEGLLQRYLDQASKRTKNIINRDVIGERLHSQLFRNIIFGCEMSNNAEWQVVNLVSETQWNNGKHKNDKKYSFHDPSPEINAWLCGEGVGRFHFNTWENLHRNVVAGSTELKSLDQYLHKKSAYLKRAFKLAGNSPVGF